MKNMYDLSEIGKYRKLREQNKPEIKVRPKSLYDLSDRTREIKNNNVTSNGRTKLNRSGRVGWALAK